MMRCLIVTLKTLYLLESWGELDSSTGDTAAPYIVHHARYCKSRSILGTGDTAIVGNLHPSLENNTYHTVHDIGLQLVGHFYLVELELSPASLIYAPHTCSDNYRSAQFYSSAP
jgi:hypothetical protein